MNTLTLYRGDYQKINTFDFNKTSKYCLFGQGVYLTSSLKIAETYRTKGVDWREPEPLSRHYELGFYPVNDRIKAYELAFDQYFYQVYRVIHYADHTLKDWKNHSKKYLEHAKRCYRQAIDERLIEGKHTTETSFTKRVGMPGRECKTSKGVSVSYSHPGKVAGHLTQFLFEEHSFKDSMIGIDEECKDMLFWDIALEHKLPWADKALIDEYLYQIKAHPFFAASTKLKIPNTTDVYSTIRRIYPHYGYRGFGYGGGRYAGGNRLLHNAYVVWDDEYVNEHKVRRFN